MARNTYRTARRSIWYVLRTLIIVAGVVALCLGIFIEGMHISNLYIISTEGMEARAGIILNNGDPMELTSYFTDEFIMHDEALHSGAYEDFTVASFEYGISVESVTVFPWSKRATMVIKDGLDAINASANDAESETQLPEWTPCRYKLLFVKDGSKWLINTMVLVESNPPEKPKPTPDMSLLKEEEQ